MKRVVLDANIFVSAVISPSGVCSQIIQHVVNNPTLFELVLSPHITQEILNSLTRPKILLRSGKSSEELGHWLQLLEFVALNVCRDPDDEKYLAAARVAHADLIVSGDQDLLTLTEFSGIPIKSPRTFATSFAS